MRSTIDDSEARLDVIDESVYKLVAFFLPKVLAQKGNRAKKSLWGNS